MYLKQFDPWKSPLCTCRKKYSLDPYTGCSHGCLYCYASSYIKDFYRPRVKKRFIEVLKKDLEKVEVTYVSMSNSSDPYQPLERKFEITRKSIELLRDYDIPLIIVTKSDLVLRDIDLLSDMNVVVSITITTMDERLSRVIEPQAPTPTKRLEAIETLGEIGIPTVVRVDPIIPMINDNFENVIEEAIDRGARHVVVSTYKAKYDNFKRVTSVFSTLKEFLLESYIRRGVKAGGSIYLSSDERLRILERALRVSQERKISLGFCRENFPFPAPSCDGSHLLRGLH